MFFEGLVRRFTKSQQSEESWPSLVLLLQEYRPLSDDRLLQLADKCYGMSSPNGRISPQIVSNTSAGRILRVQFFSIHVPEGRGRYEVPVKRHLRFAKGHGTRILLGGL